MNNVAPAMLVTEAEDIVFGSHMVADYWGVEADILDDPDRIMKILVEAAKAANATVIDTCIHQFSPYGVTATVTLAESHIAFHSWPEHNYCAVDVFVCGKSDAAAALEHIRYNLKPLRYDSCSMKRGKLPRFS